MCSLTTMGETCAACVCACVCVWLLCCCYVHHSCFVAIRLRTSTCSQRHETRQCAYQPPSGVRVCVVFCSLCPAFSMCVHVYVCVCACVQLVKLADFGLLKQFPPHAEVCVCLHSYTQFSPHTLRYMCVSIFVHSVPPSPAR